MILNKYPLHLTLRQRLHLKKMSALKFLKKNQRKHYMQHIQIIAIFHVSRKGLLPHDKLQNFIPLFQGINSYSARYYLYIVKISNSNAWQTNTSSTASAYSVDVISKCGILKCIKCGSLAVADAIIFTLHVRCECLCVLHNQFPMQQHQQQSQQQPLQFSILLFRVIDEIILNANFGQISFIDTNIY